MADLLRGHLFCTELGLSLGLQPHLPPSDPEDTESFGMPFQALHSLHSACLPSLTSVAPSRTLSLLQTGVHPAPLPMMFPLLESRSCLVGLSYSSSEVPSLGSCPPSQGRIKHTPCTLLVIAHCPVSDHRSHFLDSKTCWGSHFTLLKSGQSLQSMLLSVSCPLKHCD